MRGRYDIVLVRFPCHERVCVSHLYSKSIVLCIEGMWSSFARLCKASPFSIVDLLNEIKEQACNFLNLYFQMRMIAAFLVVPYMAIP